MITLAWIAGMVVTYLVIGFGVAAWDMTSLHARIAESPEYCTKAWNIRAQAARWHAFGAMAFWPLCGPFLVMSRLADKRNPDLIARELRQREQAIADRELEIKELERRMKIGKDKDDSCT